MAAGGNRHGIESGVTMVAQGFRDAALYHMSAKDTLHDVGITGITTFSTGIAFDILSRHWSGSSGGRLKSQAAAKLPKVQERVPGELPIRHIYLMMKILLWKKCMMNRGNHVKNMRITLVK